MPEEKSAKRALIRQWFYFVNAVEEDPKALKWPLMGNPFIFIFILVAYIYIVLHAGPAFMKKRQPYKLKTVIRVYNVFQILACAYICHGMFTSQWSYHVPHPGVCSTPTNTETERLAYFMWCALLMKAADLLDTMFFILRKKTNQISFLHVYHHTTTVVLVYIAAKYLPDSFSTFPVMLNHLVHVIMYTYYLASSYNPAAVMKFKKYVTIIQLVQFTIMMVHIFHILPELRCTVEHMIIALYIPDLFFIYYLFYVFYKNAYTKKKV